MKSKRTSSGRQPTCGTTWTPPAWSSADSSMIFRALPGANGLSRSGAHDTTFPLARASSAKKRCSSALSAGGPMVVRGAISITPRSRSASARASARSSASSASRLGAGVPSPKKCVGESEVDQPMAPAAMPSRTRAAISADSSAVAARSTAARPMTR